MAKQGHTDDVMQFVELSSDPSNPPSGFIKMFLRDDQKLYILDSNGVKTQV